jgi:DNA invertase Pin-like site-specific DNA recombinase
MKRAALYLRSSKDRHDVSIQHQRAELTTLAADRGLMITREFTDVVESGKSEFRPGFLALADALKSPSRDWDTILILDTSRLGRRRHIGEVFRHECGKRGVTVIFKSIPEVDPISRVLLESVMAAMDEVHSLMSRDKGLAGMAQNIEQGYRAGGRAPRGYQLRHIDTGVVREGLPVRKSVLEPNPDDAQRVGQYLRLRAQGVPRTDAKRRTGLPWAATSLIGMEWNALTYAGCTVWNVHNEQIPGGGYVGGVKRRPRSDWHIHDDTHPALITRHEAETILRALENSDMGAAIAAAKRGASTYLLSSVLYAPDGRQWFGQRGRYYRLRAVDGVTGRQIPAQDIDSVVISRIRSDFTRPSFVAQLLAAAQAHADSTPGRVDALQADLHQVDQQINRAIELAMEMADPSPLLRKTDALEARRRDLVSELEKEKESADLQRAVARITREELVTILEDLVTEVTDPGTIKALITSVIERVELHPETLQCAIHYKIPVRLYMASPRGSPKWTHIRTRSEGVSLGRLLGGGKAEVF